MLPLTTFYRSGAHRIDVYKWDAFVTSWRFYNRAWQPQRHDRLPETSGTLWIHRGALTNQRCSLATGCGIKYQIQIWQVSLQLTLQLSYSDTCHCPASRTTLVATRFWVAVICPIIQVPHCIRVFFYFVWFVFINHIFQFYYELCTYCNILDIYLS